MPGICIAGKDEDRAYDEARQRDDEALEQLARDLKDAEWWTERLADLTDEAAAALAECMTNLDAARSGCQISRDAVLTALSRLQQSARLNAQ